MSGAKTDDWHIRLAQRDDTAAMPAIERAAGRMFERIDGLAWVAGQATVPVDRLERYIVRGHCLVAQASEQIVGFLATEPFGRELHAYEFSVHPDWQGRGIGSALLRGCMIDARNSGFTAITLTTFADVPWNAPFYRRMGFVELAAADNPRLADELAAEAERGMPAVARIAMVCVLG